MFPSPAKPTGRTAFTLSGWAVSSCGPPDVVVLVDGVPQVTVKPAYRLPDVARRFPALPGSDRAGFWFPFDPETLSPRRQTIEIRLRQPGCGERTLGQVTVTPTDPSSAAGALPLLLLLFGALPWALERAIPRGPAGPALGARGCFLATAGLLAVLAGVVLLAGNGPGSRVEPGSGFFSPLANWDGERYISIARHGYAGTGNRTDFAWFPLFPLLVRLLDGLPLPLPLAVSIVNVTAAAAAFALLSRIEPGSRRGLTFLALLPASFSFAVCYSEALSLLLCVLVLRSVTRERPWAAAASGFLASLTRPTGFLVALLAIAFLRRGKRRDFAVAVSGPLFGIGAWCAWLGATTGDPLRFFHAQKEFTRSTLFHPGRLWDYVAAAAAEPLSIDFLGLVLALVALAGAWRLARDGRPGEALYSAAVVLAPLSTLRVTALSRYVLAAFPALVAVGNSLTARTARLAVYALEAILLLAFARRFGQHWFVT